jgi:hypothetical protein
MTRRASHLIVAALVLVTALATTAAFAKKSREPITPKLGLYYGQVVGPPEDGSVAVRETELKVVKIDMRRDAKVKRRSPNANRLGVELRVVPLPCTGGLNDVPSVVTKSPIPIKNGKFRLDHTTHNAGAPGSNQSETTSTVVSGTFKTATKVVVKVFVTSYIRVQSPGQPEIVGDCLASQTSIAEHR